MKIVTTSGIVLASRISGEADLLCRAYTETKGKQLFLIKGIRKSKRRATSAAEPGTVSSFTYYARENRDISIVNDFSVEKYHPSITEDLKKIYALTFMLEAADKTSGFGIQDKRMYRFITAAVDSLSETDTPLPLVSFYLIHLLRLNGILPALSRCKICNNEDYTSFSLDAGDLRPICSACLREYSGKLRQKGSIPRLRKGPLVSAGLKKFLRDALTKKFREMTDSDYPPQELREFYKHTALFVEGHYHIVLKSKNFILQE